MKILITGMLILAITQFTHSQSIPYNTIPDWESTPLSHIATGLALVDINGDGWKDIVAANGNDISIQNLVVYYNNGDGTFPLIPSWSSQDTDYHGHCAAGDINKDGWPDVAVSVYIGKTGFSQPGRVKVYYNNGGELEPTPSFESVEFYTFSCALGDANGDGWLDIAAAASESYTSVWDRGKVFFNNNGQFNASPDWETSNLAGFMDVEFGDMDSNGFLDLVFISNQYPNAIYLSDDQGIISNQPAWQSSETITFNNSIDIGYFGENQTPGFVTTGNNQLGGDGKVRFYDFPSGVPLNSAATWISPPVGYGSGVFLADVTRDGNLDLIYGGWWLPMRIIRGTGTSFENTVAFTSSTNSVVEAIQLADLGRKSMYETTEIFAQIPDQSNAVRLKNQLVENILSIYKNNEILTPAHYCFVPNKNWITFIEKLLSTDEIIVVYEVSSHPDIVITNWDSQKGNYIFYNINNSLSINSKKGGRSFFRLFPNPATTSCSVIFDGENPNLYTLKLFNAQGICVRSERPDQMDFEIDVKSLSPGLYFVGIEMDGKMISTEVLIIQ